VIDGVWFSSFELVNPSNRAGLIADIGNTTEANFNRLLREQMLIIKTPFRIGTLEVRMLRRDAEGK
jgi:hypothetical protein